VLAELCAKFEVDDADAVNLSDEECMHRAAQMRNRGVLNLNLLARLKIAREQELVKLPHTQGTEALELYFLTLLRIPVVRSGGGRAARRWLDRYDSDPENDVQSRT